MRSKRPVVSWLLVLAAAAVLIVVIRIRLRSMPLERDEGEYAYFGQQMLHGIAPYASAYSMKFPGIFAAYAAIEGTLGPSSSGIRLGLLAASLATMAFVFLLGRRLAGPEEGAIAAGACGLMSVSPSVLGFAAHATHFVILFAAAGLFVLLEAVARDRARLFVIAGLLAGLAYTMKQHGAVFAVFGAAWLAISRVRVARIGLFLAGAAAPLLTVFAVLALAGVFQRFWFWCFVYAGSYATSDTLLHRLDLLGLQLRAMAPLAGFGLLAAVGLAAPLRDRETRRPVAFAALLAAFSAAAVGAGFFFRAHYFVMLIPAVALLAGIGAAAIARRLHVVAGIGVVVIAASVLLISERAMLFSLAPDEVSRAVYAGNPFPEAEVVGAWIAAHTRPGDRILVLGSEPEIYFYARRRGVTGYVYMYGLMEEQPYAARMQREMIAEAEAGAPELVVLVGASTSWLRGPRSIGDVFTWAKGWVAASYERIGVVEVGDPPRATWGPEAAGLTPEADRSLLVFRRR